MATTRSNPKSKLARYRAKRDFQRSPEPTGSAKAAASKRKKAARPTSKPRKPTLHFCVQKHLASHLHYDFRLEHRGVLLSWAIPKGPSLKPSDKRLAMRVEDHPLDYRTFEGVIPEGYGAGIVMLWDQGKWKPQVDDVDAALEKGDLKFTLEGTKLKGSWALVRIHPRKASDDKNRTWLLIKHTDDWAGNVDITKFAPLSVKSFGDFADILATGKPDIWESNRPATGGEAGALLKKVIAQALKLRQDRPKPKRRLRANK